MKRKHYVFILSGLILILTVASMLHESSYHSIKNAGSAAHARGETTIDSSFSLTLDEVSTPQALGYFQFIADSGQLIALNKAMGTLHFFELLSGNQLQKIDLYSLGYQSSDKIQGFYQLNSDSLLLYCYNGGKLSLLSLSKGKLWSKSLFSGRGPKAGWVNPYVSQSNPMIYDRLQNRVSFVGFYGDEVPVKSMDAKKRIMLTCDVESGKFFTGVNYPDFYWGKNWGGSGGYRIPFYTYLPGRNEFLISFLADHSLVTVSSDLEVKDRFLAASGQFDTISSIPSSAWLFDMVSSDSRYNYYLQHPAYGQVYYNQYKQEVVRLVKLPQPLEGERSYSMLTLNNDLAVVSESAFPSALKPNMVLSLPDGLWYANDERSDSNTLVFSRLK